MNKTINISGIRAMRCMRTGGLLLACMLLVSQYSGAQVISNNGAAINLYNGIVVSSKDVLNTGPGDILNNGNLNLSGNYTSTGFTSGDGFYRLGGNWTNTGGIFTPGNSTVIFNGSLSQSITRVGGETFNNLSIFNTGTAPSNRINLFNNVNVSGTLSMSTGNVDPATYTLFLNNPAASSLNYISTTGSRVIGKFERAINQTVNYLFPIGSAAYYNPANLRPNSISSAGSVVSQFLTAPAPGYAGLPFADPPVEIDSVFQNGFWRLKSNGFSTNNYNINLDAAGFTGTITSVTRLVVRPLGGNWYGDGTHHVADSAKNVVYRDQLTDNISGIGTEYAIGRARPLILKNPRDTIVCENTNPFFRVVATGAATLRYNWYKEPGVLINNGAHYSGARTSVLTILSAQLTDIGDYYCIITDRYGNKTRSTDAHLTVNKIPVATATPENQPHECSGVNTANILLGETYGVPGSTYVWSRTNPAGIVTAMPLTGTVASIGDIIPFASFANTTDDFITITITITPVGPAPTFCTGLPITATITVNPVPTAAPVNVQPAICSGGSTEIILRPQTRTMTTGAIHYNYTVTKTGGALLVGSITPLNDLAGAYKIALPYTNNSDTIQSVHYYITPFNTSICPAGPVVDSEVKVHAKPLLDLPAPVLITNPLTCEGGAGRAALRANISKGAAPYHLVWKGPGTYTRIDSVDIKKLATTGKYTVTVTDNLLCTRTASQTLNPNFAVPSIQASPIEPGGYNISCIGSSDGTIQVSVYSGVTYGYDYWVYKNSTTLIDAGHFARNFDLLKPSTYKNIPGLGAGDYTMVVRDTNNCIITSEVVSFSVPPPFDVKFGTSTYGSYNISCKGYSDGSAWVNTVSGGRGFYKYHWHTTTGSIPPAQVNTNRIDNIPAGTYYLDVTDTLNCSATFSVVITEPAGLSLVPNSQLSHSADNNFNISCNGGSNGSIDITVAGGIGNNTYRWTGPNGYVANTEDITGLKAGTYTCQVISGGTGGCELMPWPTFTLTEPAPLAITYTTSHSVNGNYEINCNGGTGYIDITVAGGSTGNYSYAWSTANGSGIIAGQADQPSLKAGTYHLVVTDINGCTTSTDVTLREPPVFSLQLTPTHISCATPGFSNGSVDLTVTGGVAPYAYSWSNGAVTEDISGLTQGYYKVQVTYNNSCSKYDSVKVNLPPSLTFSKQIKSRNSYEVSCYGQSDGQITVNPLTGKAPFSYSWTGPNGFTSSGKDLNGLKAGEYHVTITDSNLCTAMDTIMMREPGPLGMTFALSSSPAGGFNINCAGDSSGLIIVQPMNSVNNVRFLWEDGFTGRTRSNMAAGTYKVVITDDNQCSASASAILTHPDSLKSSFVVKDPFCPDMPDGSIAVNVTGGVKGTDYIYKWSDNSTGSSIANIASGLFKVRIEDMNGCVLRDSVIVKPQNETCLGLPNIISPNGDLINDYWEIERKELYPNMEVKIFNRRGRLIWKSERGYGKPWDGKGDGKELPIDSYHYFIDLHDGSKPVLGTITIVK